MDFLMDYLDTSSSTSTSSTDTESTSSSEDEMETSNTKIRGYVQGIVPKYSDGDFKGHFRLSRTKVEELIIVIGPDYFSKRRSRVPLNSALLSTLWLLANEESFRGVADRFGFSKGHLHHIVMNICQIISSKSSRYIRWPHETTQIEDSVRGFNKLTGADSFQGVVGCVDGTHILIPGPVADNSYYTRKGVHALHLQGVCNSKMEFIDVFCGWPGSSQDARVWKNSPLGQALEDGTIKLPKNVYLLGDTAYPLKPYLIVPFKDNGRLSAREKKFNRILSSSRVVIENAFGRLKGIFRRLKYLHVNNLILSKDIMMTCCVLNNIIINDGYLEFEPEIIDNDHTDYEEAINGEGSVVRKEILNKIA